MAAYTQTGLSTRNETKKFYGYYRSGNGLINHVIRSICVAVKVIAQLCHRSATFQVARVEFCSGAHLDLATVACGCPSRF